MLSEHMRTRIQDWWRGYRDEDRASLAAKIYWSRTDAPGTVKELTTKEMNALLRGGPVTLPELKSLKLVGR